MASLNPDAVILPFPSARVPQRVVPEDRQRSYEEIAASLGFEPAELTRAQLIAFFEREGITLYDHAQVSAWLTEKREQAQARVQAGYMRWCWRPLREKDVITDYRWGVTRNGSDDGYYTAQDWGCRPYDRLVPQHALEKVVQIQKAFGDRVKFFVSDFAVPSPDPFIMVRPAMYNSDPDESYRFIFDYWNEPGFGT